MGIRLDKRRSEGGSGQIEHLRWTKEDKVAKRQLCVDMHPIVLPVGSK